MKFTAVVVEQFGEPALDAIIGAVAFV